MDKRISELISLHNQANCILIVSESINALDAQAEELFGVANNSALLLGKELSQQLLTEPINKYATKTEAWLKEQLKEFSSEPIVCKDIDLLFEPEIGVDPLFLFKQAARQKKLVILWPGSFRDDTLYYASPDHSHYRSWPKPEIDFITIEG